MKVTVIFENNMNEDGEDSVAMFSKEDVVTVEDMLNVFGRASHAGGFTYLESLQAFSEKRSFWAHF